MVSIVIPTRNGMRTLPGVFAALAAQQLDDDVEVVAIDTDSTDGTLDLLRERATRVLQVPLHQFNHGATRNQAVAETRGALVVILSQDAEPADERWLHHLTRPLRDRPSVAGTFARQLPRPHAGPLARHYHQRWAAASAHPRISRLDDVNGYRRLSPPEKMQACAFDNVCSCIRREVWTRIPFRTIPIAEDLAWSQDVLLAGHSIEFVPDAVVRHSHDRSAWYEYQRTVLTHQQLHALFGVRTIPNTMALVRAITSSLRLHLRCLRDTQPGQPGAGVAHALALAVAWPLGQYVGGRRAVLGRPPRTKTGI